MDELSDIISLSSSPPGSLTELPKTFKKVSEMCMMDYDIPSPSPVNDVNIEHRTQYHTLSDSESEEQLENGSNSNFCGGALPKIRNYLSLTEVINHSPPKTITDKMKLKEQKILKRLQNAKEKAEKAAKLEKIRQSKPGQCMKYITVLLDDNIINSNIGMKAIELFNDVDFKFSVKKMKDQFSVMWIREEPSDQQTFTEEKHILLLWSYDKIITSVKYCTLIDSFKELKNKYEDFRIYLAIYGIGEYYKNRSKKSGEFISGIGENKLVKKKSIEVTRNQVEMTLAELEVILKVSTRILKNHHELALLLKQITKAIAETPHRKVIEKRDLEKNWYARGDSRDCVKIDKDFNGLHRLWLQQLMQFNKSSLDIAKSIAELYPSPTALYEAYQNLPTQKEKELLLQDIQIKKGNSSSRRIGPELSKKISLLFSQKDGDIYLSQE